MIGNGHHAEAEKALEAMFDNGSPGVDDMRWVALVDAILAVAYEVRINTHELRIANLGQGFGRPEPAADPHP